MKRLWLWFPLATLIGAVAMHHFRPEWRTFDIATAIVALDYVLRRRTL